tara:strand:+ start:1246 stop:2724 length:1479 start_codon:yes stop_codon:yes gene_type:complete
MGITLQQGFSVQSGPLDDRTIVANESARFALVSAKLFEGLVVYQTDTDQLFVLKDVNNKGNINGWAEVTNQNNFPFSGNAVISGSLEFYNHPLNISTQFLEYTPTGDKLKVQKDNGDVLLANSKDTSTNPNYNNTESIFTPAIIDDLPQTTRFYSSSNIIINFDTAKKITEINHTFVDGHFPNSIEIYGSNKQDFTENPGRLLTEGAAISSFIDPFKVSHSNPITNENVHITSSIPLFRQELFQYYRIRYSGSLNGLIGTTNYVEVQDIRYSEDTSEKQPTTIINNDIISSSKILANSGSFNILQVGSNLDVSKSIADNKTSIEALTVDGANFSDIKSSLIPGSSTITGDVSDKTIGNSDKKWKAIFAQDTFFGGIHEINLETEGLDKMQEGTVLTIQNGTLHPCNKEGDPLVMGIVSKESNYPIILGAEPVLITGTIKEGDYIITSNVKGHGKGINPKYIYNKQLFGKIIAQAIENGKGKSYTIKAMIRKM